MDNLKRSDLKENIVTIKINKSYREGMSDLELYDITRGCWKRKLESVNKVEYAFAVAFGIVKEVYKIDRWFPAEELNRETVRDVSENNIGRIAFEGTIAEDLVRSRYKDKSVADLYKHGEADPVKVFFKDASIVDNLYDINVAAKPAMIIQTDSVPIVVCPNCEFSFNQAPRCPECGQLIQYGKERWNKPKLENLDAWERESKLIGATAKEVADFVRNVIDKDGFSYHVGAVDLAIDLKVADIERPLQIIMLFGKGPCGAFQPKEMIDYLSKYELDDSVATWFMESMKPYLSENQKNIPYERLNGYYYVDFATIVEKQDELLSLFMELQGKLSG